MIRTIRSIRYDPAVTQFLSERLTVITFIKSQPLRTTAAFNNLDAIYRFKEFALVMPVGLAQCEVERIAVRINHQVAFEPVQTVFS